MANKLKFSDEELALISKYTNSTDVIDILNKFGGDIDKLKSYVKWLYKYGGTGSRGNGSGGGSYGLRNWTVIGTFDGKVIGGTKPILLSKSSNNLYQLKLSIGRPGDSTYNIDVNYNGVAQSSTKTISAANNSYILNFRITQNGELSIFVKNNDTDDTFPITIQCVLNPHKIEQSLINNSNTNMGVNNSTLYIKNINNGLKLRINHDLYVEATNVKLKINLFGGKNYPLDDIVLTNSGLNEITNNSYTDIDLYSIIGINTYLNIDDIVGTYTISGYFMYTYDNNAQSEEFNFTFTLIPEGLYLKVTPRLQGAFIYRNPSKYTQEEINVAQEGDEAYGKTAGEIKDNTYKFTSKNIIFNITAYDNTSASLKLGIEKNGEYITSSNIYPGENQQITIQFSNSIYEVSEHEVTFSINNGVEVKNYVYYIYVDKESSDLLWFDNSLSFDKSNYFRGIELHNDNISNPNININNLKFLNNNFNAQGYVSMGVIGTQSKSIELYKETDNNFSTVYNDLLISIGIQYNNVNTKDANLLQLSFSLGSSGSPNVIIRQDCIIVGDKKVNIFIPKETDFDNVDPEKYHLLNILIRNTKNSLEEKYAYEFVVFIDGFIENAYSTYFSTSGVLKLTRILAYEANYAINLLDVEYVSNDSSNYNLINDVDIVQYYYKYNNYFNISSITQEEIDYFKQIKDISAFFEYVDFYNSSDEITTSVIKIKDYNSEEDLLKTLTTKNGIPINHNVPFLILHMNIKNNTDFPTQQAFFETFLNKTVTQDEFSSLPDITISSFTIINDNGEVHTYNKGISIFKLQGSSTGKFKSKNFTLSVAPPSGSEYVALFTPNFKAGDTTSFLPEVMFTFKADAVDSTHANNTSAGLFINKNTTPFNDSRSVHTNAEKYKPYIKNCLVGFPILTIFGLITLDESGNETITYYYMGIYNCNLGRDSYLNLGYYHVGEILNHLLDIDGNPIGDLTDGSHNGFGVYLVENNYYQPIQNLCVAEIQGGNNYFDFSQFGQTILFEDDNGNEGMFGDFYPKGVDLNRQKQKIRTFVRSISIIGGAIFENLKKYMSEDNSDNFGYKNGYTRGCYKDGNLWYYTQSTNSVPNYKHQFKRSGSNFEIDNELTQSFNNDLNAINNISSGQDWTSIFTDFIGIGLDIDGNYNTNNYSNTAGLFSQWFYLLDYNSLVEYYTICMAFGLVDSVMKNLNIKSFKEDGPFYIAFYDMDTSFGRDNGGEYVDPFAFSDYWRNSTDKFGNITNTIYRDFYPDTELPNKKSDLGIELAETESIPTGYDVPSSYLFAIAKYAKTLYNNNSINQLDRYKTNPNYFWYKLRYSENSNTCELKNAKYFIDNYFGINLNKINRIFFNANYRYKYLQKTQNGFNALNIGPFHGRGLYSLEDWLSKRLHILDAYFNITQINVGNQIQWYDNTDNTWKDIIVGQNSQLYDPKFTDVIGESTIPSLSNPDIYLLKSIFGETIDSGLNFGGGAIGRIQMKTLDYSPMVFNHQGVGEQFICVDSSKDYIYQEAQGLTGNITWTFGGSIGWTNIKSFNTLIPTNKKLTLNAPYLEDIIITDAELIEFNPINIQSVKKIQISSTRATCLISLENSDLRDNYPNLREIDIHQSGCNLYLNNLNVSVINANEINAPTADMKINNCLNLTSCNFNKATLQSLDISSIWGNNIIFSNTNIKSINIRNTQFNNASIKIANDETITNLSIMGFEKIEISNCPNLSKVTITEDNTLTNNVIKSIIYKNNSNNIPLNEVSLTEFNISNGTKQTHNTIQNIDLSPLSYLEEISFESINRLEKITLPNVNTIKLLYRAFYETNLQYINFADKINENHKLMICDNGNQLSETAGTSSETFMNSHFKLSSDTVEYGTNSTKLYFTISQTHKTSLGNIFRINASTMETAHNGSPNLKYLDALNFINNLENKENVQSLYGAFFGQIQLTAKFINDTTVNLKYYEISNNSLSNKITSLNIGTFVGNNIQVDLNDITNNATNYDIIKKLLITLDGYVNLTNIQYIFENTNLNFIHKYFFGLLNTTTPCSQLVDTLDLINFVDYNKFEYFEMGSLDYINKKMLEFLFDKSDSTDRRGKFKIYGNSSEILDVEKFLFNEDINLVIFTENPNYIKEEFKIQKLSRFNIMGSRLNFNNLFKKTLTVNSIQKSKYGSLSEISYIFSNLNQCTDSSTISSTEVARVYKMNELSIANLTRLRLIDESFKSYDGGANYWNNPYKQLNSSSTSYTIDTNKLVNLYTFLNWENNQLLNLDYLPENKEQQSENSNLQGKRNQFRFYKQVNLTDDTNKNKWNSIIKKFSSVSGLSFGSILYKVLYIMPNDDYDFKVLYEDSDLTLNITSLNSVFQLSTAIIKNPDNTYQNIGLTLCDDTFKHCKNVTNIAWIFTQCCINAGTRYPIPDKLFYNLPNLINARNAFSSPRYVGYIDDNNRYIIHKTYISSNNTKQVYYIKQLKAAKKISRELYFQNYILDSIEYDNAISLDTAYPCLPENLFENNNKLNDITQMFYGTTGEGLEGYLPENLFKYYDQTEGQYKPIITLKSVSDFIWGFKLLPQRIYENISSVNSNNISIYNYSNNIKIYTFIPENLFENITLNNNIADIFTFNMLLSSSELDRLYLFTNNSLYNNYPGNISLKVSNYNNLSNSQTRPKLIEGYYQADITGLFVYVNNGNLDRGYINLCINKDGDKYSEGIDLSYLSSTSTIRCLIDENLANVYYGYIFKKGTIITKQLLNNIGTYIISMANNVSLNSNFDSPQIRITISQYMIFPTLLYYNQYIPSKMNPKQVLSSNGANILYSNFVGSYKETFIDAFITILTNNQSKANENQLNGQTRNIIWRDNIDTSCITREFIDEVKTTTKYSDYKYLTQKTLEDHTTVEDTNYDDITNRFKSIIYNNYHNMFNTWWAPDIPNYKQDSSNTFEATLNIYNTFVMGYKDSLSELRTIGITDPINNDILKEQWTISGIRINDRDYVDACNIKKYKKINIIYK